MARGGAAVRPGLHDTERTRRFYFGNELSTLDPNGGRSQWWSLVRPPCLVWNIYQTSEFDRSNQVDISVVTTAERVPICQMLRHSRVARSCERSSRHFYGGVRREVQESDARTGTPARFSGKVLRSRPIEPCRCFSGSACVVNMAISSGESVSVAALGW